MDAYKNLYWTRLIAIENFLEGEQERYAMSPDIADMVD